MKTGHDFLREMCKLKADFSSFNPRPNPITSRVQYIIDQLTKMKVGFEIDMFEADYPFSFEPTANRFVNVIVRFKAFRGKSNDTVIFMAHHDVKVLRIQNAQDNTASVCNLVELCQILKGKRLRRNIVVCFTDAEEVGLLGAKRLAESIVEGDFGKVLYAINLELSGLGSRWFAGAYKEISKALLMRCQEMGATILQIPPSDSLEMEHKGIKSICVGILPESDLKGQHPRTWLLCHKRTDTIKKTSKQDMSIFVNEVLLMLATEL